MSKLFAEQLAAVANVVLASLAIVTAVLAGLAFWKQAREVRDQAEMLDLQRRQLDAQREDSARQAEVLALQSKDLRESIKERARLRNAAERAQADEIGFRMTATSFPYVAEEDQDSDGFAVDEGTPVHMAVVSNGSRRPITDVECSLDDDPDTDTDLFPVTYRKLAVIAGRIAVEDIPGRGEPRLFDQFPRSRVHRILPGEVYGFVFERNSHFDLGLSHVTTSFTDDAGLRWRIDSNQHLEPLPAADDQGNKATVV